MQASAAAKQLAALCVGSAHWDLIGNSPHSYAHGSDFPGVIHKRVGGVAYNIALALARQGMTVALLAAVGRDAAGAELLQQARSAGIDTDYVYCHEDGRATDSYMAIEGDNGVAAAIADQRGLEAVGARILQPLLDGTLASTAQPWSRPLVIDGNLPSDLLASIAANPVYQEGDLRVVSASSGKAERLRCFLGCERASLYLNLAEARALLDDTNPDAEQAAQQLAALGLRSVTVTDGAAMLASVSDGELYRQLPPKIGAERRCTGAGDHFVAIHLAAELQGQKPEQALRLAANGAAAYVAGDE